MDRQERGSLRSMCSVSRCRKKIWLRATVAGTFVVVLFGASHGRAQDLGTAPGALNVNVPYTVAVPGAVGAPPFAGAQPAYNAEERGRAFIIAPRISLEETATDNVRSTATGRQSDLITTIAPGVFMDGQSTRLKGSLDYSPTVLRHITATDQDTVVQNMLGNGTFTAVPDLLFFDANASMSQESRSGARGFSNTSEVPSGDSTQEMAFAGSPYARFHLGDVADSEIRYRLSQAHFSGNTGAFVSPITGQALSSLSDATEQEALASVTTSQQFSRLQGRLSADYDTTSYSDTSLNSRREETSLDLTYPVTQAISALASGGYERLTYSQQSQLNTIGPTYKIGARYARNDQQMVEVDYGRHDGENSFSGVARYALTPVTTISATYNKQRVSTQQQTLQGLLTATPTGPGTAINSVTGLPTSIINGVQDPNVPLRNDILVSQNAILGITNAVGRDSYSILFSHVDQTSLLHLSSDTTSNGAVGTWSHQISPSLTSNLSVSYALVSPGSSNVGTIAASLGYALTDTLQAGILYNLFLTSGGAAGSFTSGGTTVVNNLTLSLTKTF